MQKKTLLADFFIVRGFLSSKLAGRPFEGTQHLTRGTFSRSCRSGTKITAEKRQRDTEREIQREIERKIVRERERMRMKQTDR